MSSLHHHPMWPAASQELELSSYKYQMGNDFRICPGYHPKKAVTYVTLIAIESFSSLTTKNIVDRIGETSSTKGFGLFRVNPDSSIEDIVTKMIPNIQQVRATKGDWVAKKANLTAKVSHDKINEILRRTGLTFDEYKTCVANASKMTKRYFDEHQPLFAYGMSKQQAEEWRVQTVLEMGDCAYQQLGLVPCDESVAFSDDELAAFGVKREEIKIDPEAMSCLAFALLKTGELKGKDVIFKGHRNSVLTNIFQTLEEWNYCPVKYPDEGDLVVYLDDKKEGTHVGYVNAEGKVHSKLGLANPRSHMHKFYDIPAGFGTTLVFFRKSR
jgi:hypothetical protein